jgi:hypothetical protein
MTLAWHINALARRKELPDLRRLLVRPRVEKQTPKVQKLVMEQLSARLGIPLRRTRLIQKQPDGQ